MGMPIPKAIQNAPELRFGLQLFYMAFLDLSGSRSLGMSEGMIPWPAVQGYCDRLGLSDEQTEDMHYHLLNMDVARRNWAIEKEERSNGKSGPIRTKDPGTR